MPGQPCLALRRSLAAVSPQTVDAPAELRRQLCDFVDALKERDVPLGSIVRELHELFRDGDAVSLTANQSLLDTSTRICIEYYYGIGRHWS